MHRSILDQLYPGEILTTLENIEGNRTDYKDGRESVRFLNYCSILAYCNIEQFRSIYIYIYIYLSCRTVDKMIKIYYHSNHRPRNVSVFACYKKIQAMIE